MLETPTDDYIYFVVEDTAEGVVHFLRANNNFNTRKLVELIRQANEIIDIVAYSQALMLLLSEEQPQDDDELRAAYNRLKRYYRVDNGWRFIADVRFDFESVEEKERWFNMHVVRLFV